MWRIEQRIERLNDLGFDVDELDIVTDFDGDRMRIQPKVVELGHHQRELQALTGLHVEEDQARRLLNDIAAFTAHFDLGREDRTLVANQWLTRDLRADHGDGAARDARQARAGGDLPRDPRSTGGTSPSRPATRSTSSTPPATTSTTCCRRSRGSCRPRRFKQVAADDHPLDLVGALEDLGDLGVAEQPLDGVVTGVAVAAEHLHGVGGHPHRGVGGGQLGDAGLPARTDGRRP